MKLVDVFAKGSLGIIKTIIDWLIQVLSSSVRLLLKLSGIELLFNTGNTDIQPQPYSNWNHPDRCFVDKIISFLFPYFVPFHKFDGLCSDSSSNETLKIVREFREALHGFGPADINAFVKIAPKYNVSSVSTFEVKRKADILTTMCGVDPSIYRDHLSGSNSVKLIIYKVTSEKIQTCSLNDKDLYSELSSYNPILIWFHGGGMMCGDFNDMIGVGVAQNIVKSLSVSTETLTKDPIEIILVSVDMSLAPECPFPAGITDCLSVVDHIFSIRSAPINVGGTSAGANYAAVVALEYHRKYGPGWIQCALVDSPFLDPFTSSNSYYMNSESSGIAPVNWLRWCWRSYLSLGDGSFTISTKTKEYSAVGEMKKLLLKSKWFENKDMWRMCNPTKNLPTGLSDESATTFILVGCRADPLYDDAIQMHKELIKIEAKSLFVVAKASHALGLVFDSGAHKIVYDKLSAFFR